jgi:fructose-1,6-bisphosphatase
MASSDIQQANQSYRLGTTITEHLLLCEDECPDASGQFTRLLSELITSAKLISREVNKAGLADILGMTGDFNVQGEKVLKLDEFANRALVYRMERSGLLCAMSSEESADIIQIPENLPRGSYILSFDPLDGSSNVDANVSIGTIFSIHRKIDSADCSSLENFLRYGYEQVAAGYFLYGSSTMLVYSAGKGVHGFTLDPSVGEFLLSHQNITMPASGTVYSVNEAYTEYWDEQTLAAVNYFKSSGNRPFSTAAFTCTQQTAWTPQNPTESCGCCARRRRLHLLPSRRAVRQQTGGSGSSISRRRSCTSGCRSLSAAGRMWLRQPQSCREGLKLKMPEAIIIETHFISLLTVHQIIFPLALAPFKPFLICHAPNRLSVSILRRKPSRSL